VSKTKQILAELARNRYVFCALVFLGTVGPGIVKLSSMLEAIRQ